ncbi:UBN2_3 domain-containing protein, partial [Cephalotus follicularis]
MQCNLLSWIMNTVSKELFNGIVCSTDALAVWKELNEIFNKINGSRSFSLHRKIGYLTQGNVTMSVYFSKLRQLWDEYASLLTLQIFGCQSSKAYVEHNQQQMLLPFLMGLNESYGGIKSQILMISPLPTISQA